MRRCLPRRARSPARDAQAALTSASKRNTALPETALLPFAQLDLPGKLGPADGRYLLRPEEDPEAEPDVLVLTTLGAARAAPRLRRGKVQALEGPAAPPPLPLSRVTLIRPTRFPGIAAADAWLEQVCAERELWTALAAEAGQQLNRALHAYRTAAGDPYIADVDASRAIAVRFGYGSGEEVADGRWRRANELNERQRRKLLQRDYEALRPQERMAAVLGGRQQVAPYEGLVLRARADYEAGRIVTAELGLRAALGAMLADPGLRDHPGLRDSGAYERLSAAATLPPAAPAEQVEDALKAAEAALRRRAAR